MDLINPHNQLLKQRVRDAVLSRAARVPGIAFGMVSDAVSRELEELRSDVDAAIAYINQLPEQMRKKSAYEFFAAFFDHYLPKKLLRRYVYGGGSPPSLVLTEQEMIDCNPYINVNNCAGFEEIKNKLGKPLTPALRAVNLRCPATALTNGTLGQFTVIMDAKLVYRSNVDWELKGKMSFYDEWNFDPKDFETGGRSVQGELKTRFAHYTLPGHDFTIESVEVEFSQSSTQKAVDWKGGAPVAVPDRLAELDVELKNAE